MGEKRGGTQSSQEKQTSLLPKLQSDQMKGVIVVNRIQWYLTLRYFPHAAKSH